jgi:hypothetical protein
MPGTQEAGLAISVIAESLTTHVILRPESTAKRPLSKIPSSDEARWEPGGGAMRTCVSTELWMSSL